MIIKNANVLMDNFIFEKKDVLMQNGKIVEIANEIMGAPYLDGENCFLTPGLIDIHTHGCVGSDSCDGNKEGYAKMSKFYAGIGVTSFLFTTMTLEETQLSEVLEEIADYIDEKHEGAYSHGIYLEGPFINPVKKGAQAGEHIVPPQIAQYGRLQKKARGKMKVVALAPEMAGSMEFIEHISKECAISIAHTAADYDVAIEAIQKGATGITHLFNAMPPLNHRQPGVVGAAFDSNVFMEMICDGIHLHASVVRTVFAVGRGEREILISDSMCAAGMADGTYSLGGQKVMVEKGKATLADGTIAGSASNLLQCLKTAISFGIKKETAIKAATINPARMIGVDKETGSITVGKYGDLILFDAQFNIKNVWIKGELQ